MTLTARIEWHRQQSRKASTLALRLAGQGYAVIAEIIARIGIDHARRARAMQPRPAYLSRVMSIGGLPLALPTRGALVDLMTSPVGFALWLILLAGLAVAVECWRDYRQEQARRDAFRRYALRYTSEARR